MPGFERWLWWHLAQISACLQSNDLNHSQSSLECSVHTRDRGRLSSRLTFNDAQAQWKCKAGFGAFVFQPLTPRNCAQGKAAALTLQAPEGLQGGICCQRG